MREIKFREWQRGNYFYFDMSQSPKCYLEKLQDEILEQYTGLTDANGTEIYEGDVVRLEAEVDRGDGRYDDALFLVSWNETTAGFTVNNSSYDMSDVCEAGIVTGNIHENPELMEVV